MELNKTKKILKEKMGILEGKVAIVTGAGRGLGKYEAIALAKEGAAVTGGTFLSLDPTSI